MQSLLLCPQTNGNTPQSRSSLRSGKLNRLKRKDLRSACVSKSQVFVCYSGSYFVARHNADLNLSVTESEFVIRLRAIGAAMIIFPSHLSNL